MRMPEALPLTSMPPMTSPMKSGQMPVRQYSVHLERGNGLPTLRCMVGDTGARGGRREIGSVDMRL